MTITVSNDAWYDVNTLSGISAGTDLHIQNRGQYSVVFIASSSTPDDDEKGEAMATKAGTYTSILDISNETETIYAKVLTGSNGSITRSCMLYVAES